MSTIEHATGRSIERTREADFTAFYSAHYPRLLGSLVLFTGDRELAMDLAQEALARAYRDWRKVTELESPPAWLHRVGFNLAKSTFRRKLTEWRTAARTRAPDVHHDADTPTAIAVRGAVASLPTRQRMALVLRYYADLPVGVAAEVMGCAQGTVRALTAQALGSLRRSGLAVEEES